MLHTVVNFSATDLGDQISKLFYLAQIYSDFMISVGKPTNGIRPLQIAAARLMTSEEQINPIHREYAKLCLKAKCYSHSLDLIKFPVTDFHPRCKAMDIIVYCYYRGMLFTGLQMYEEAIESFTLVLSLPTNIAHKVHQESFKKLILLSLIGKKQ